MLRRLTSRSVASSRHFVAIGLDQHVSQNRNRVLALDNALEELKFSQEVVLADDEFHVRDDLEWAGGTPERVPSSGPEGFRGSRNYTEKEAVEKLKRGC